MFSCCFFNANLLKSHVEDCKDISEKAQRIKMPEKSKNIFKLINHCKQIRILYIIFADFEALNLPVDNVYFKLYSSDLLSKSMKLLLFSSPK